jgi:hypothetical protein
MRRIEISHLLLSHVVQETAGAPRDMKPDSMVLPITYFGKAIAVLNIRKPPKLIIIIIIM